LLIYFNLPGADGRAWAKTFVGWRCALQAGGAGAPPAEARL